MLLHPNPAELQFISPEPTEEEALSALRKSSCTLIVFHAQKGLLDEAVKDDMEKREIYETYLNRVAMVLENQVLPITNVVVFHNRHKDDDFCYELSEDVVTYPRLHEALKEWAETHPYTKVHHYTDPCCKKDEDGKAVHDEKAHSDIRSMINYHQTEIQSANHHIILTGLFDHECSKDNVSHLLSIILDVLQNVSEMNDYINVNVLVPYRDDVIKSLVSTEMNPATNYFNPELYGNFLNKITFQDLCIDVVDENYEKDIRDKADISAALQDALKYQELTKTDFDKENFHVFDGEYYSKNLPVKIANGYADWYTKPDNHTFMSNSGGIFYAEKKGAKNPLSMFDIKLVSGLGVFSRYGANQTGMMVRFTKKDSQWYVVVSEKGEYFELPTMFCTNDYNAAEIAFCAYTKILPNSASSEQKEKYFGKTADYNNAKYKQGTHCLGHNEDMLVSWVIYRGYLPDARNTNDAWMETTAFASYEDYEDYDDINKYINMAKGDSGTRELVNMDDLIHGIKLAPGHKLVLERLKKQLNEMINL